MNKLNVTRFLKNVQKGVTKRSPEILTGIGVAGMITTTVLAVKATPKALILIEEEKEQRDFRTSSQQLKPIDVVKIAWKPYVPAMITGSLSIVCVIGASSVHTRRNAALATAYQLSASTLRDYRDKVVDVIGEEKEHEVIDRVIKDKTDSIDATKNKQSNKTSNVVESFKDIIFYDIAFGQTFYSDVETIRRAVNDINSEMLSGQYASLNDFYDALNIDRIAIGESLGWNISRDGQLEVSHSETSVTKDGRPCYVLEYHKAPTYNYYKS